MVAICQHLTLVAGQDLLLAVRQPTRQGTIISRAVKSEAQRRERFAQAYALTCQQDAHLKIELGGVMISAGADRLDPAELFLLLASLRQLTPEKAAALRQMVLDHFDARKAARAAK